MIEQRGQFGAGDVGARNGKFVFDAVVSAMADQHQHQSVGRLGLAVDLGEAGADLVARGRDHGDNGGIAAGFLESGIDIVGQHFEALDVIGFAAQAGEGDVEGGGVDGSAEEHRAPEAAYSPQRRRDAEKNQECLGCSLNYSPFPPQQPFAGADA